MFIKFCESKYNLAKDCQTIALGTLQYYADDSPDFLRHDYNEGCFEVKNEGAPIQIDGQSLNSLTAGSVVALNGAYFGQGSNFTGEFQFPNCYMFCFSQDLSPSIEMAKKIDPAYDDWYLIHDLEKFINHTAELLLKQLKLSDLEIDPNTHVGWVQKLTLQIVHGACSFDGRKMTFNQGSLEKAVEVANDPLRWAFAKNPSHDLTKEYRVMFILLDYRGQIVPVKKSLKVLNLQADIGVSIYE